MPHLNRRSFLLSTASFGLVSALPLYAQALPSIHVAKGTGCECCSAWVEHLRAEGFTVTEDELYGTLLINYKIDNGIPQHLTSCHTGKIDGYMIEGHVPAADICRLLQDRPDAIGLADPSNAGTLHLTLRLMTTCSSSGNRSRTGPEGHW